MNVLKGYDSFNMFKSCSPSTPEESRMYIKSNMVDELMCSQGEILIVLVDVVN